MVYNQDLAWRKLPMNTEQLIAEACSLPLEQRAHMVERLLQTLSGSSADNEQSWLAVARQRLAEIQGGKTEGVAGEDVFKRIFARYGA